MDQSRVLKLPDGRKARIPDEWGDDQIAEFISAASEPEPDPVRMTPFKDGERPTSRAIERTAGERADMVSTVASLAPVGGGLVKGGRLAMRAMAPQVAEKTLATTWMGQPLKYVTTEAAPSAVSAGLQAAKTYGPDIAKSALKHAGSGIAGGAIGAALIRLLSGGK